MNLTASKEPSELAAGEVHLTVWPLRDIRAVLFLSFSAAAVLAACWLYSGSGLMSVLAGLAWLVALWRLWLPRRFVLSSRGIVWHAGALASRRIVWAEVLDCVTSRRGVTLSLTPSVARPGTLYLPFADKQAEIVALLRSLDTRLPMS